jgi:hypothetical protein
MKYYHGTWTHKLPDQPDWMAYEVSDEGAVLRMIEHFALGWADYRDASLEGSSSLVDQAFDPASFALDETMALREIAADHSKACGASRDPDGPMDGQA